MREMEEMEESDKIEMPPPWANINFRPADTHQSLPYPLPAEYVNALNSFNDIIREVFANEPERGSGPQNTNCLPEAVSVTTDVAEYHNRISELLAPIASLQSSEMVIVDSHSVKFSCFPPAHALYKDLDEQAMREIDECLEPIWK